LHFVILVLSGWLDDYFVSFLDEKAHHIKILVMK
jgi:hypothetical protein